MKLPVFAMVDSVRLPVPTKPRSLAERWAPDDPRVQQRRVFLIAIDGGAAHARVPIIMTANTFASLAGSLTRPGRMRFFTWQPTWPEKADMVLPIFGERTAIETIRLRRMLKSYHGKDQGGWVYCSRGAVGRW
jgi:hypothetical protein